MPTPSPATPPRAPLRPRLFTPLDVVRVVLGWTAVLVVALLDRRLAPPVAPGLLVVSLAVIVGVIVLCAFGVVHQAEALARRLGDPYGSLVLTLSIVLIEVVLISAVMLGPGDHATIGRDSVMAVSMIILNLVVGLALLVGGIRHGGLAHQRTGASTYLALLVVLLATAFGLPAVIGDGGSFTAAQQVPIVVVTVVVYAFFLVRQMGAQADDFREPDPAATRAASPAAAGDAAVPIGRVLQAHRREILGRLVILVVTVTPIVLLSHSMAALLDDGLGRLGTPAALSGVLIAMIVFLPESLTSIRAALGGEAQRVINLCHGALVSTVGLTIPAVLVIGALSGQRVVSAESPANLMMLGVTLLLSLATFSAPRLTAVHGAVHLAAFVVYGVVLFS